MTAIQKDSLDPDCTPDEQCALPVDPKTLGPPSCEIAVGNPINSATGNKYQPEADYAEPGAFSLHLTRHYNSQSTASGPFGTGWSAFASIQVVDPTHLTAHRPDGRVLSYTLTNGTWTADADVSDTLVALASGYRLTTASDDQETYAANGQLLSLADPAGRTQSYNYNASGQITAITDATGRSLTFTFDAAQRIATLTDPAGGLTTYAYDPAGNLTSVTYPDLTSKTYHYESPAFPHALTGISDETGARYATWTYDPQGRALSSEHAGGAERVDLTYNADGSTTVTDALGSARTYGFTTVLGVVKGSGVSQPGGAGCAAASSAVSYDAHGNVASRADFNGHTTTYSHDLTRNLETTRSEAVGTPEQRTVETDWHPRFRLPVEIREKDAAGTLLRTTRYTYDGDNTLADGKGDLTRQAILDPVSGQSRLWTWSYTYHPSIPGVLLQKVEDGPRSDVADLTTWDYYPPDALCEGGHLGCRGQLRQVTNALGHVTQVTRYSPNGQPETPIDPNGTITTLEYWPRGWLKSRTVAGESTLYDYDQAGQLTRLTRPDGGYVEYLYDAAHRLTDIVDPDGNRLHYTLDGLGNRTGEEILNAVGDLFYTHSRQFDALGRLWQDIGAYNQTATHSYDAHGNLKTLDGPRTDVADTTQMDYDALNRLSQVTHPDGGAEHYALDALDRHTGVQDPNQLTTLYTANGLGNTTRTESPDTGITTRTYDEAGNLKSETDARGYTTTYTYDALNRVVTRTSSEPSTPAYAYTYDTCTYGIGHLCWVARNGALHLYYDYDPLGRLAYKLQFTADWDASYVVYTHDPYGRLSQITYPTDRTVTYAYDTQGRVSEVRTQAANGASATVLANNFAHFYPFAGPQSYRYGNGKQFWMSRDQDYRPDYLFDGPRYKLAGYNEAGDLNLLTDIYGHRQEYGYDANGRLLSLNDTAAGGLGSLSYLYDLNGNRTSETRNGATQSYVYSPTDSNWLYQAGSEYHLRDPAGNTAFATATGFLGYDGYGRLIKSSNQNTSYQYNALGERSKKKSANGAATVFHYGAQGELLYERDAAGHSKVYVWLDGRPLARIDDDSAVYYYHTDHLGTPQVMTDSSGAVVWRVDYEPYGKAVVKVATVGNNLRLPGQYYDQETGMHYNYFRDYDPGTGRYAEGDPIGLAGGINLYAYVGGNPLSYVDPLGLFLEFSNSQRSLTWVDPNTGTRSPSTTWPARSGSSHLQPLPQGWYYVNPEQTPVREEKTSMTDTCGNAYKFRLLPQFETNRSGLLIHPDGGKPGTAGCIGAQGCTSSLRQFLESVLPGGSGGGLNLKVVP